MTYTGMWMDFCYDIFLNFFSFVAVVLSRNVSTDYDISPYALAMKSVWTEWGNIGY